MGKSGVGEVVQRLGVSARRWGTAAYALRDLGSEAGYRALLQASNAPSSWPGIGDIIYEVREKTHRDKSH